MRLIYVKCASKGATCPKYLFGALFVNGVPVIWEKRVNVELAWVRRLSVREYTDERSCAMLYNRTFLFREELTINAIPTSQQASAANFPKRGQSVQLDINPDTTLRPEKKHEDHSLPNSKGLIWKHYLSDGQGPIRAWLGGHFWLEIQPWSCHFSNDKSTHPAKPSDRSVFFLL